MAELCDRAEAGDALALRMVLEESAGNGLPHTAQLEFVSMNLRYTILPGGKMHSAIVDIAASETMWRRRFEGARRLGEMSRKLMA